WSRCTTDVVTIPIITLLLRHCDEYRTTNKLSPVTVLFLVRIESVITLGALSQITVEIVQREAFREPTRLLRVGFTVFTGHKLVNEFVCHPDIVLRSLHFTSELLLLSSKINHLNESCRIGTLVNSWSLRTRVVLYFTCVQCHCFSISILFLILPILV